MSSLVGIHTLVPRTGADSKTFENFMTEEAFPTAAETPGSVSRGGQSAIKSQHLLKANGESSDYLWLVKSSGVFADTLFSTVFTRMYDEVRNKLESFATRKASSLFTVLDSLDVGPRDTLGRPTGNPTRGSMI